MRELMVIDRFIEYSVRLNINTELGKAIIIEADRELLEIPGTFEHWGVLVPYEDTEKKILFWDVQPVCTGSDIMLVTGRMLPDFFMNYNRSVNLKISTIRKLSKIFDKEPIMRYAGVRKTED